MNDFEIACLFPCPIYISEITGVDNEIMDRIKNTEFEVMASGNGKYTKSKYILFSDQLKSLREEVDFHVNQFVYETLKVSENLSFYLTNSWVVKHSPGDWGQRHFHTNSVISGVLYLECPENSGDIVFHRDNFYPFSSTISLDYSELNFYNTLKANFKTKKNKIILFPSMVVHSIDKNLSNEDRYSLAFNYFVKGKFGTKEFELYL